jgi:tetratricopeptide (TPR) repeat protein
MRNFGVLFSIYLSMGPLLGGQDLSGPNQQVREGQEALYRLDYAQAEDIFKRLIEEYPDSPVGYGMLSIATWNQLLFAASNLALDDYASPTPFTKSRTYKNITQETQRFREATDNLLALCEKLLKENPQDPLALYFEGLAYENLAAEAIVITKSRGTAFNYGRKANSVHKKVLELDPDLIDAQVSIAGNEFAKATLPWSIKWLAVLVGIRGDKEGAFERLEQVSQKGQYRQLDAQVLLAVLHSWKGDPLKPVAIFQDLREKYPQNFLFDINLAAVHQFNLSDAESALGIYQQLLENLSTKAPGLLAGQVYLRIGLAYLQLDQHNLALQAFTQVLKEPKGEMETAPLAYFHMAQIHEQRGEKDQAIEYYQQVLKDFVPQNTLKDTLKEARRRLNRLD